MKVAINGFGRIGRAVFKAGLDDPEIDFVAVNDLCSAEEIVYLLKHDSVYGRYEKEVKAGEDSLLVDGKEIKLLHEKDPAQLPWTKLGIDIACESTGLFTRKKDARKHLEAGASKVLISAPAKDEEKVLTINYGINHELYDQAKHDIVSNASCTTNSVTPMLKVLNEEFGIENAVMTTVHAYTSTQNLIDGPSKKPRRRRAAAVNLIPTTTGSATDAVKILPELQGKFDAMAMRAPIPCGSVSDLSVRLEEAPGKGEVNEAFKRASSGMNGILEYSQEELVSSDIIKDPHSVIIDSKKTMQLGKLVKVLGWYDNEWGFSCRMVDVMKELL